ncbi:type IV secretory system conjugative DNA transfer family protein [Streptomyces sp. AC04842]|uniref:type IV secretory system conjugative DNA transfer family protein n=1 Tax=Streptomyces sp. AC04842 TaxID=2775327 RepID=UPI0020C6D3B5|nr:type IV secretory system conjugative DNA transfer family protein [Streptomyces sp. AC04842]
MSRTEENPTPTTNLSGGVMPHWMHRIRDVHKPCRCLIVGPPRRGMGTASLAAGLPAVAGASETNGGLPAPSIGAVLDGIGTVASNWHLGGIPGFALTLVGGAGLGYLHLKQKFDLGKSGPTARPKDAEKVGFATPKELKQWLSESGLRNRADVLRPSLGGVKRRSINPHDLGLNLGTDLLYRKGLFLACEDLVLMYAPPRMGKSAQLGNAVIDAAGSVVVTSTRGDLYENTHKLRREHNRPVWVFNAGVSGVPNTLRWNLVEGCEDASAAIRRAGYILAASASGEDMENASFWEGHSFTVLSSYLMAAALKGGDLMTVRHWVTSPTEREPLEILQAHYDRVPAGWAQLLGQMLEAPEKTRDSVYLTLVRSFQFMSHPEVVEIVSPRPGEQKFDVQDFLNSRGTLYVMGRDMRYGSVAPLFSALVGEIYDAAYVRADNAPGGRLDPYLRMVLDEAAVICPLPLHLWSADAGGRNIQLLVSVQSPSQLRERWGRNGAQTIMNNSVRVVLGGLSLPDDLEELSLLCGEKDEEVVSASTSDEDKKSQSVTVRRVRVMPQETIRQMKEGTGLVFYRHLPPIRYSFTPVWERKDVRDLVKQEKAQAKLDAKLKKKGVQVNGPVLPPQMPATAPVFPSQPGAVDAPPAAAPGIPGQPGYGYPATDADRWRYTG